MINMSDDDWIRAANRMEQFGKDILAEHPGHFRTYLAETYITLAKAYYHADLSNQRMLRLTYATVFFEFHMLNRLKEATGG